MIGMMTTRRLQTVVLSSGCGHFPGPAHGLQFGLSVYLPVVPLNAVDVGCTVFVGVADGPTGVAV